MNARSSIAKVTLGVVLMAAVVGGIEPRYRLLWLAENALVVVAVPLLIVFHRRHPISDAAWVAIGAFLLLHLVGAHYGYNEFPLFADYARWGWSRNHYDRVVHFAFGLLVVVPCREWIARWTDAPRLLTRYLAITEILAMSAVYELIEWGYAATSDSDAGPMFLGAQGDAWDAHKDMALALLGAVLTMSGGAITDVVRKRAEPVVAVGP
jgi:putative membrane protein